MINRSFKDFKFRHKRSKNQIIYKSKKIKDDQEISGSNIEIDGNDKIKHYV